MRDMYKQDKDTIDVLYVGDSNIYTGVSPFEIYDKTGITGYAASTPQQDVIGSYYAAKELFKTQSPKIVMIDTAEFFTYVESFTELGTRSETDYMNWGINKLEIINEKEYNYTLKDKLSYIFPLIRFHDRYDRLTEFDIRKIIQKSEISYKGYLYETKVSKYENKGQKNYKRFKEYEKRQEQKNVNSSEINIQDYVKQKIEQLNELCKQHNCELVLITMPNTDEKALEKYEVFKEFAQDKGLKYVNFNFEVDEPIDWEIDTPDKGYHLNIKGAEKVGEYISKYLKENFEIESKKENPKYIKWNQQLEAYKIRKTQDNV